MRSLLDRAEREEIIPVVPSVPGTDLHAHHEAVTRRFSNEEIADTLARLCLDGSNRQPKFILPSTRDRLARGLPVPGLTGGRSGAASAPGPTRRSAFAAWRAPPRAARAACWRWKASSATSRPRTLPRRLRHGPRSFWTRETAATLEGYVAAR